MPTNVPYPQRKGSQSRLELHQANGFWERFVFYRQKLNAAEVHLRKQRRWETISTTIAIYAKEIDFAVFSFLYIISYFISPPDLLLLIRDGYLLPFTSDNNGR